MDFTDQIIMAHTKPQKQNILSGLGDRDKENIVKDLENKVLTKWDSCVVETTNSLITGFSNLDEQILKYDSLLSFVDWTYNKYTYGERKQKSIFQWDIFYCDLGNNIGSEKNKTRPVVVIQKTKGYLNAKTLLVAPITIGEDFENAYKHEIIIDKTYRGNIKGKIDLSHIRSVDKSRLDERFIDRLLKPKEYESVFGKNYITTPMKVKKALKQLFSIDT